jgi:hypothetical protein
MTGRRARRAAWSTVLVGLALSAAACSSGGSNAGSGDVASQTPDQIISAAKGALSSASSVRLTGHVDQGSSTGTFDLTTFRNGNFAGHIAINGYTVRLVRIGDTDYLNAPAAFYESQGTPAAAAQSLGGKWVDGTDSQVGFGNDFTLQSLSSEITKPTPPVTKGATGTVNGQSAVPLHSPKGTLWVAASGTPYPVELVKTGSTGGVVQFSAWNQGSPPTAPSGAVSLNSLGA